MSRFVLPVLFAVEVLGIALLATVVAFLPVHNMAVAVSSGVTAALIANALLPCPCHKRRRR